VAKDKNVVMDTHKEREDKKQGEKGGNGKHN
jgi:hypothetical protein